MITTTRQEEFETVMPKIEALTDGETNDITLMATIACELYHGIDSYHWVGFYRVVAPELLKVGPYQGGHGCLVIPFDRGICGRCAAEQKTQLIADVNADPAHIACSSTTLSEVVLPVFDGRGELIGVLDIDSDLPDNFSQVDVEQLTKIADIFRRV